jgi:hypothetical protein
MGGPGSGRYPKGSGGHPRYLYSTIKGGKVKVTSNKQHKLLHARNLPQTEVYRSKQGLWHKLLCHSLVVI